MLGCRRMSVVTVKAVEFTAVTGRMCDVLTGVVGADLVGLIASHHEADLLSRLVLEETDVARASFLPLRGIAREPEELRAPVGSHRT